MATEPAPETETATKTKLKLDPPDALLQLVRRGPGRYRAVVDRRSIRVDQERACSVWVRDARAQSWVQLEPSYEIRGERAQVGFGERFSLLGFVGDSVGLLIADQLRSVFQSAKECIARGQG